MKVLIVDDETLARQRIRRMLSKEDDVTVVGECTDGEQAVEAIKALGPDVVFLDVQMPELDGFAVLGKLHPTPLPAIVFVTAYDAYAIRAFEVHALDYLLKPFDAARFHQTFARVRVHFAHLDSVEQNRRLAALVEQLSSPRYMDRLMVRTGGKIFFMRSEEIDWVEAAGNYVKLHSGRDAHLVRETMAAMERQLDPARFVRIHRSTIVNLDRVREMQPWFSGEYAVILRDGTQLRLSRVFRDKLEERMRPRV